MAKTTVTHVTDDINGDSDAQTIEFSYKGVSYVIDLAEKNEAKFDKAMASFVEAATRVSSARKKSTGGKRNDLQDVRSWAKDNGFSVSERGRLPADVLAAYDAR